MPLLKGRSLTTFRRNIREFHTGKTYARTRAKFGKKTADKQAVAAAYSARSGAKSKRR
jgi:hypothetical protein